MMTFRTLDPSELEAWYAHCHSVFTQDAPGYFKRHYEMDPHAETDMIFVAMDGQTIASTVRVFCRTVWLAGRAVAMGGIGEVSTKPDYRRQGLASELLRMAIAQMEAREMPVSILFGRQQIYVRDGWRFCTVRYTDAGAQALPPLPDHAAVRPFAMDDLPALMGIYDLFAGRLDGAVLRSEAYWRQWVLPQWRPPAVLLLEGRPAAYCCAAPAKDEGLLYTPELCAAPQAQALLPAFLRRLAEDAGHARVRVNRPLCPSLKGEPVDNAQGMMVRLNLPLGGIADSDALVASMPNAGMFAVDHF